MSTKCYSSVLSFCLVGNIYYMVIQRSCYLCCHLWGGTTMTPHSASVTFIQSGESRQNCKNRLYKKGYRVFMVRQASSHKESLAVSLAWQYTPQASPLLEFEWLSIYPTMFYPVHDRREPGAYPSNYNGQEAGSILDRLPIFSKAYTHLTKTNYPHIHTYWQSEFLNHCCMSAWLWGVMQTQENVKATQNDLGWWEPKIFGLNWIVLN